MTFTHALTTNNYGSAKYIVDSKAQNGTHTSIAGALAAAVSGDTIFIRPGTYTENPSLKAGVNLTAYGCDSSLNGTGHVIINGKCTYSDSGTTTLEGIQLQTNSDFFLTVSGNSASIINLNNCYLNASNNGGISHTTANGASVINIFSCNGNLGTTGIAFFASSSGGSIAFYDCNIQNGGHSTTASTSSSTGSVIVTGSTLVFPITTSSSAVLQIQASLINPGAAGLNVTAITHGGSSSNCYIYQSIISSGSASAISVGATLDISLVKIISSNSAWCIGAGTATYSDIAMTTTASVTTTTQSGGATRGIYNGVAPSSGFIGEQIRGANLVGQALTSTVPLNITSISLTAGIWNVSGVIAYSAGNTGACTSTFSSISTVSASNGTDGDNAIWGPLPLAMVRGGGVSIPDYRLTLSTTTTVYLVADATITSDTVSAYGRICATRVG